jgi:hypothetical protein
MALEKFNRLHDAMAAHGIAMELDTARTLGGRPGYMLAAQDDELNVCVESGWHWDLDEAALDLAMVMIHSDERFRAVIEESC